MSACTECHGMAGEKYDDHTSQHCPRLERRQVTDTNSALSTCKRCGKEYDTFHTCPGDSELDTVLKHLEYYFVDLRRKNKLFSSKSKKTPVEAKAAILAWHHQQLEAKKPRDIPTGSNLFLRLEDYRKGNASLMGVAWAIDAWVKEEYIPKNEVEAKVAEARVQGSQFEINEIKDWLRQWTDWGHTKHVTLEDFINTCIKVREANLTSTKEIEMKHPIIQLVEYYDEYLDSWRIKALKAAVAHTAPPEKPTFKNFMAFLKKKMEDV